MLALVPLVNINVGMRCNTEWYEILMSSVPRDFIWSVVGIVLTPTSLKLNILSSSVKLLSEVLDRFHILFTAHVNGELISSCSIRFYCHNINWVILKGIRFTKLSLFHCQWTTLLRIYRWSRQSPFSQKSWLCLVQGHPCRPNPWTWSRWCSTSLRSFWHVLLLWCLS